MMIDSKCEIHGKQFIRKGKTPGLYCTECADNFAAKYRKNQVNAQ